MEGNLRKTDLVLEGVHALHPLHSFVVDFLEKVLGEKAIDGLTLHVVGDLSVAVWQTVLCSLPRLMHGKVLVVHICWTHWSWPQG